MITYEIFLAKKDIDALEWKKLINIIANYVGCFKKFQIFFLYQKNIIRHFVKSNCLLPITFNGLDCFYLKRQANFNIVKYKNGMFFYKKSLTSSIELINYCATKKSEKLKCIELDFRKITNNLLKEKCYLFLKKNGVLRKWRLLGTDFYKLLAVDFNKNKRFFYKSASKYLDISKLLHLLSSDKSLGILGVDTFPYLQGDYFLKQNSYDFFKHSLIIGSSGSGKSKFISNFIKNIYLLNKVKRNYKVVVIDPHASLEDDIGGLGKVIDFKRQVDSIDLFLNKSDDVITATELLLELFSSLIADQYNSKLERVLRHAIYILLINETFSFNNLKAVLLDLEYRNNLLNKSKEKLPSSVLNFFLTDFTELKTKSYGESISPIISFIDEMEMLPLFNEENSCNNLYETINKNFLTVFSLDKTKLGDKVTKTIAGLIMQQLLMLVQGHAFKEQIIFIIDEVAVVENPILARYLAEARKYNLALILAGQYFNQISEKLKTAIFANVINYYIFRVARADAINLVNNFNMKIPLDDQLETKIKMLTELNNRELIVRLTTNGILIPAFKARTLDFKSIPRKKINDVKNVITKEDVEHKSFNFELTSSFNLKDVLKKTSASRKEIK